MWTRHQNLADNLPRLYGFDSPTGYHLGSGFVPTVKARGSGLFHAVHPAFPSHEPSGLVQSDCKFKLENGPRPFRGMRFFSPAAIRAEPLLFVRARQHGLPNATDRQRRQVCHKQAKAR